MLYALVSMDYDSLEGVTVCEGPDGVDVTKLRDEFYARLSSWAIEQPVYPKYAGPELPLLPPGQALYSGAYVGADFRNQPKSAEYQRWNQECERIRHDRQAKLDKIRTDLQAVYPGNGNAEMFVSYLIKEHGFKVLGPSECIAI